MNGNYRRQTYASFIMRLEYVNGQTIYLLYNLGNGTRWEGRSWEELRVFLAKVSKPRLK